MQLFLINELLLQTKKKMLVQIKYLGLGFDGWSESLCFCFGKILFTLPEKRSLHPSSPDIYT